jgi:hypothetical protein
MNYQLEGNTRRFDKRPPQFMNELYQSVAVCIDRSKRIRTALRRHHTAMVTLHFSRTADSSTATTPCLATPAQTVSDIHSFLDAADDFPATAGGRPFRTATDDSRIHRAATGEYRTRKTATEETYR